MKGLLVAVQIAVVKVGVFIEPPAQLQGFPAPPLVEEDLATLKFRLPRAAQATTPPYRLRSWLPPVVRPKNGSGCFVLACLEQTFRVDDRHIIRVQEQHFLEGTMEDGVRFEFPTAQLPHRMFLSHAEGIDALDSEWGKEGFHFSVEFARAQMPQLNRQPAPQPPEHVDAHPGVGKISDSPAANNNAPSSIMAWIFRDRLKVAFAGHPSVVQGQRLLVVGILCGSNNASLDSPSLSCRKVLQHPPGVVKLDAANDFFR